MKRSASFLALGVFLAACFAVTRAKADEWNRETIMTINQPVTVGNTCLLPGKYIVQIADSASTRSIVDIYNAQNDHLVTTILANPTDTLNPPNKTVFDFYETSKTAPAAISDWYYPGSTTGIHFLPPPNVSPAAKEISNANLISAEVVGE